MTLMDAYDTAWNLTEAALSYTLEYLDGIVSAQEVQSYKPSVEVYTNIETHVERLADELA